MSSNVTPDVAGCMRLLHATAAADCVDVRRGSRTFARSAASNGGTAAAVSTGTGVGLSVSVSLSSLHPAVSTTGESSSRPPSAV